MVDPATLPAPQPNTFQSGYAYLHADRRLIAYNLEEPGMERLQGPPLPFEREMLGARTAHEWAHLADAVARLCACHAVDTSRLRLPTRRDDAR